MIPGPLINADWNFWPDGLDRATIWRVCAQLGFTAMEVGVYRADDELSTSAVAEIAALEAETDLGVEAVSFSMPAERWPDGGVGVGHRVGSGGGRGDRDGSAGGRVGCAGAGRVAGSGQASCRRR